MQVRVMLRAPLDGAALRFTRADGRHTKVIAVLRLSNRLVHPGCGKVRSMSRSTTGASRPAAVCAA
jgi:hypothetical protein